MALFRKTIFLAFLIAAAASFAAPADARQDRKNAKIQNRSKASTSKRSAFQTKNSSNALARAMPPASLPFGKIRITETASDDDKIKAVFRFVFDNEAQKHGWPANYTSLWCPSNIHNLLRRFDQVNIDLSKANVWYIVPQATVNSGRGENSVHPRAARRTLEGAISDWSFHVVLEFRGLIYDLDYTDKPNVATKPEYGFKMWAKGPLATSPDRQPLFVRVIPARDYLVSYTGNWSWYLSGGAGLYAPVDFGDLLAEPVVGSTN